MRRNRLFIFFAFLSAGLAAQDQLSLQQAIEIALKNNFSIQVSKSQSDIAANDVTLGNAGMLPQVSLNASGNSASNNTHQNYLSGLELNRNGVSSNGINYGAALNWTLFDGLRMFAAYNKLKELKAMGELNLKIEIENDVAKVINGYYDAVRQKQLIKATSEAISLYQERQRVAEMKLNVGSGSQLEVRQAQVDLNAQKSQLMKLQTALFNAKAALNQLLARAPETNFNTEDSIPVTYNPKYEDLKTSVPKQNTVLLASEKNMSVAGYSLKQIRALRYPVLGVNANYNYSRSESQAGFVLLNKNSGLTAGFTASWNLFNGFEVNRQTKDLQIQLLISKTQYDMNRLQLDNALATAFRNFQQAKDLLQLEEDNNKLAKENVDVALESFRVGKISTIELKDVEKSLDDANIRLMNARFDAKAAETELMRLNGMLVK